MDSRRVYGPDILRAYAILTVVYAHSYDIVYKNVSAPILMLPAVDGVTVFFVLSGYLIGNITLRLVDKGRTSWADLLNFWQRRWLRTLPNYMLVLTGLVLYASLAGKDLPSSVAWYFAFLQNFLSPHPAFFAEARSLSVEEWFYLLFPCALFLALRFVRGSAAVVLCIATFILVPTALRIWRIEALAPMDVATLTSQVKMQVVRRLDSIVYGVLTAFVLKTFQGMTSAWRRGLFASGVALFALDKAQLYVVESETYIRHFTLVVESLGTALLLPYLSTIKTGAGKAFSFLTFTSKVSYAMYLLHYSVASYIVLPAIARALQLGDGPGSDVVKFVLYWTLAYGLAYLLYRFYEQPILRLRDRLWPDPSAATLPSPR